MEFAGGGGGGRGLDELCIKFYLANGTIFAGANDKVIKLKLSCFLFDSHSTFACKHRK